MKLSGKYIRAIAILSLLATSAFAQFGEVSFANSGAEAAQPAFLKGLALLHDFEYSSAAESFREAQKIDPDFVMAYWGEAMTYTHPVWYQQDADAARAVLQRLGDRKAKTDRENAYLQAIRILYGEGSKNERDNQYAGAMAALHEKYPDDVDATAFYAVALLGTSHNGRDTATYMRAAALLEDVFPAHQHHPGVLHYLIHCYDDPVHAPLGMRAARLYGAVAPEAAHALHMTSHIFIAMGMWDNVIDANVRAIKVANAKHKCGHYFTWLHYALLQRNRVDEAKKLLDTCRADAMTSGEMVVSSYADMVASQAMSGFGVDAGFSPPKNDPDANFTIAYAEAYDAYRRRDPVGLHAAVARMKEASMHAGRSDMMGKNNPQRLPRIAVILQEVDAMELAVAGKHDDAIAELRKAATAEQAMPFDFGPPFIEKPTVELLADELLALKRNEEAAAAYRAALARTPGRAVAVQGLRAAESQR